MKCTKTILTLSVIALGFSCQRGEDDPMISLLSRKKRLEGSWKVSDYSFSKNDTNGLLSGDSLTISLPDSSEKHLGFSIEFVFNADGSFTQKQLEILSPVSNDSTIETLITGNWEFTGGNDSPPKSKLALFEKDWQQTTGVSGSTIKAFSTTGQAYPEVFDIKELRKDKVVLTQYIIESDPFSSDTTTYHLTLIPQEN